MKGVGASLPLRLVAPAVVLGAGIWAVLNGPSSAVSRFPALPALGLSGPGCATPADQASARARVAEFAAFARMARYPFNPEEGVEAARLMDEGLACARTSGDLATAMRLQPVAQRWAERLEADYRSRVVRVKVALDREGSAVALREVQGLRRLLGRSTGDYVKWLEQEERRLEHGGARE